MNKPTKNGYRRITGWGAWLSAALIFATGCVTIDDNTDDCYSMARLQFQYIYNLPGEDRFAQQVESVDLYVFSKEDSTFVRSRRFEHNEMTGDRGVALTWLPMEDYIIAVFGNLKENQYACRNYTDLLSLRLSILCGDGLGTVTTNPVHFFYGITEVAKQDRDTKTVDMIKDTNDITVILNDLTIGGGTRVEAGPPNLSVHIRANNGSIKHDNSIAEDDPRMMTYIQSSTRNANTGKYTTKVTVGRLFDGDGTTLEIKNTDSGALLVGAKMTDAIIMALQDDEDYSGMDPNEYLDKQDSYMLVFDMALKHGATIVTLVKINDWTVIQTPNGMLW